MREAMERPCSVLIVDDMPDNLNLIANILNDQGHKVRLATSGEAALQSAVLYQPDIILLDINMPKMDGFETCRRFKENKELREVPVIFLTAQNEVSDIVKAFSMGAVDYVTKPFRREELVSRVSTHLKIRSLQEELRRRNQDLQTMVSEQVREIEESQLATIKVLAAQAEFRDNETGQHIKRVQEFCRILAKTMATLPDYQLAIDGKFVEVIYFASVLHDIGKVGIPDNILLKPAALSPEETEVMRRHTVIGAANMEEARRSYPNNSFINMGIDIALYHHERWDGGGYPRGLAGESIPLAARIMNLADQYDALRSERPYKNSMPHQQVRQILLNGDGRTQPEHFDPRLISAFRICELDLEQVYDQYRG